MECYYCGKDCKTQKIDVYIDNSNTLEERDVCEDCVSNVLEDCVNCGGAQERDGVVRTDWYQIIPYEYYGEDYEGYSGYNQFDVIGFFETHHHCDSCMKGLFKNMSWLEIYEQLNKEEKE